MALVSSEIICNNKKIFIQSLSITQRADWHHSFRISVSSEIFEGENSISIDNSVKLIGKNVEIQIKPKSKVEGNGLAFKGIITSVNIDRSHLIDNLIIISGYSPTYLLEDGIGCKSYEKQSGADIFKDILSKYPRNLLTIKTDPAFKDKLPYFVKYKETNYQFLSRLAAMHGEWMYYNGTEMVYGKLQNKEDFDIVLGSDLHSYEYGVSIKPSKFTMLSYDYTKNSQLKFNAASSKPGWLHNYSKKGLDVADSKFPGNHMLPSYYDISKESTLKKYAEIRKAAILAESTKFNGQSTNPSFAIGARIGAKTETGEIIDRFRVISVTHHLNSINDYNNTFEALPISTTAPPINYNIVKPEAETNFAVVTDNEDPDGLGRVRVQFNWQDKSEKTPWIRVATAHASDKRGFYFTPEIEDEVIVDFEQGNPDRPYVCGTVYHGKKKPEWKNEKNNLKAIKTRSGHTIRFDDTKGKEKIEIFDAKDNKIILDTKKETITISSVKKLVIESKDIEIKASNNMTLQAGNNMKISAKSKIDQKGANIAISAQSNLDMKANKGATLASNMNTEISGKVGAKLSSDLKAEVAGTMVDVAGKAMTNIKGAMVKIN